MSCGGGGHKGEIKVGGKLGERKNGGKKKRTSDESIEGVSVLFFGVLRCGYFGGQKRPAYFKTSRIKQTCEVQVGRRRAKKKKSPHRYRLF